MPRLDRNELLRVMDRLGVSKVLASPGFELCKVFCRAESFENSATFGTLLDLDFDSLVFKPSVELKLVVALQSGVVRVASSWRSRSIWNAEQGREEADLLDQGRVET